MVSNEHRGSVSEWLLQLKESDDPLAMQKLWERYMTQLVNLANKRLGTTSRKMEDQHDVASVVFQQFLSAARQGKFPKLNDRDDLWQILAMITRRRVYDIKRKRQSPSGESSGMLPADFESRAPTNEEAVAIRDELNLVLESLDDESFVEIASLKMSGHTNDEIAEQLACSTRTIERKLGAIRKRWSKIIEQQLEQDVD